MTGSVISRKYAQALFQLAEEKKITEKIWNDLELVESLFQEKTVFKNFMEAPKFGEDKKKSLIITTLENHVHPFIIHFLLLLLEKHRITYFKNIVETYLELLEASKGVLRSKVITAFPLSEKQKQRLIENLERETGKKIRLEEIIDKEIIGGIIVMYSGHIIDMSIKQQLKKIAGELLKVKVH